MAKVLRHGEVSSTDASADSGGLFQAFLPPVEYLIPPDQHFLDHSGGMNGCPANYVVRRGEGLVPRADRDATAAAAGPLPPVDCPEGQASLGVDVPFPYTRVIVYAKRRLRRWTEGNSVGRTVGSAVFTGHTKLVDAE